MFALFTKRAAQEQGGLLNGIDPTIPNDSDPIRLWIVQLGIIVTTASLLSLLLQRIRQPKVIAEVIGGILLGKTAFGRIPGFTKHIFPDESKGYLSLTANIGLCLFLFMVGLEIDGSIIRRNAKLSATIGLAGMVLPFGFGVCLSIPLYREFIDSSTVKFTHFMLFTGVAYSITAFPVLCRILTELKLLDTTVGIVVLSAGVANDVIGWTLLALSIALVNAGSGLTALYVLLVCVGWTFFVLFPLKHALLWLGRKTGSIESGQPTMFYMTVIVMCLFGSAFFTDIIGVHAIFGAFLVGIIVPRNNGLAMVLVEKLEDFVGIIFLPLYFTLSGLSTDLGLLNDGKAWGYTLAICSISFTGKFGGCTLAARFLTAPSNFSWRESATIGSLMSCKGLVELIVLNVGLSAGILSPKVFSMFVLEALTLTFLTTPLVVKFYPPDKRVRVSGSGANFNSVSDRTAEAESGEVKKSSESRRKSKEIAFEERKKWTTFTVVLDNMEHLPSLMAFTQLVKPSPSTSTRHSATPSSSSTSSSSQGHQPQTIISLHPLRLLPLSDRLLSSTFHISSHYTDPVLMVYRMFLRLLPWSESNVAEPKIEVMESNSEERATCVTGHAESSSSTNFGHGENRRTLIMMGWLPPPAPQAPLTPQPAMTPRSVSYNPFDALFKTATTGTHVDEEDTRDTTMHAHFVRRVFGKAVKSGIDAGLFVELAHSRAGMTALGGGIASASDGEETHIYLPFFGGPDDRSALEFVVQLCEGKKNVKADVVWVRVGSSGGVGDQKSVLGDEVYTATMTSAKTGRGNAAAADGANVFVDTVYPSMTHGDRIQCVTLDGVIWDRYSTLPLSKVTFRELNVESGRALRGVLDDVGSMVNRRTVVVTGRSRRLAVENHSMELKEAFHGGGGDVRKTVGDVAAALMSSGASMGVDGVVIIQTGGAESS
ncbi:hypothetical protein E1B28_006476 [Marasmius oreades]|uniref:Cation/H+ exchanger transmembrane domain-containing protein n=1 Tax=Marasmius oreades TaxID=181124 RepID=A0A9P7S5E2_9AGAR|nr:uncharacterized protein E1B28_006476 [Marasmius oreades]KAG7095771.1 hypothetical protein E1B28_006476 [Marasmius oreades]